MNHLTFIKDLDKRTSDNRKIGLFECSCGKEVERITSRVFKNTVKSCGCLQGKNHSVHGLTGTPEYKIWASVKGRVFNKANPDYSKYNKLGMSENLANNFLAFLDEVGHRPTESHSIDRIDNKIGYFEGNLRWATREMQGRNKKNSYRISINGNTFDSLADAAKYYKVAIITIVRWCDGYGDKRRLHQENKGYFPPKEGCHRELYY